MTALNCFLTDAAGFMYTDGATYDESTGGHVMGVSSKVLALPHYNAVVGFAGVGWGTTMLALHLAEKRLSGFDALKDAFPMQVKEVVERTREIPGMGDWGATLLMLMGWSETLAAPDAIVVRVSDNDGYTAFQPVKVTAFRHPAADDIPFDPQFAERDGLALMEAQRRMELQAIVNPAWLGHYVGGFCQQTVVTAQGIQIKNLKTWPDRIGKVINPKRDDDDMSVVGPGWRDRLKEIRDDD